MSLLLIEFKKTKRDLKQHQSDISEVLDDLNDEKDVNRKQKTLQNLKMKVGTVEKTLMELETKWSMLDPQDKANYRNKITKLRGEYEQTRKQFYKLEDSAKSEQNRQKFNYNPSQNSYDNDITEDQTLRKKLLNGTESLYEQDKQLDNTKKMGHEANTFMKLANKQLYQDREILINVNDRNAQIRADLERGNKIIVEMSMREYIYKLLIHTTAFLLLIAVLAVFIHNLSK